MSKSRIKPERIVRLSKAVAVYINQLGDLEGKKCFLITDVAGKFHSFVLTADAEPLRTKDLQKNRNRLLHN